MPLPPPPRKPPPRRPRPDQGDVNRQQGVVNEKSADLFDALVADGKPRKAEAEALAAEVRSRAAEVAAAEKEVRLARTDASETRADVSETRADVAESRADTSESRADASESRADASEALSAEVGERRDAEHVAQGETNVASELRADASEERAASATEQRDAEFLAQAVINEAAVSALVEVGKAATAVTDLLQKNIARGRRWTGALAVVVALVVVLGALGAWRFSAVNAESKRQRATLAAQTAALAAQSKTLAAQTAAAKAQAHTFCIGSQIRSKANKKELTFLVNTAIGPHNPSAALRKFKADYPAHLAAVYPPVVCP